MKSIKYFCLCTVLSAIFFAGGARAEDFRKDSKITQVAGDVANQPAAGTAHPAILEESVVPGDVLKTGPDSRAELTAGDATVIRVGANSIFSFSDQTRQMILQQGSVLFHTPHGEGGGVIKTAAVTAAVTGSTVAMSTTPNGGAKVVPLESPCTVTGSNGRQIARIFPGQLLVLLPGGGRPIVVSIDLGVFAKSSGLIKSFGKPLSSAVQSKIDENVSKQGGKIAQRTNIFLVGDQAVTFANEPPPDIFGSGPIGRGEKFQLMSSNSNSSPSLVFDPLFLAKIGTDLTLDTNFLGANSSNIFPLIAQPQPVSPLAYIQNLPQNMGLPLSTYFAGLGASDNALATLGITQAFPASFGFPSLSSEALIGNNITLSGVANGSGLTTDLSSVQNVGFLGIVALGNLVFRPTDLSNTDFNLINGPAYISFGSSGTINLDGSVLSSNYPGYSINFQTYASNLSFGSVGLLNLNNVCLHTTTGNIYVGSQSSVVLNSSMFQSNTGNFSIYSGGPLTMNNTNFVQVIPVGSTGNINVTSLGNLSINGFNEYDTNANYTGSIGNHNVSFISTLGDLYLTGSIGITGSGLSNTKNTLNFAAAGQITATNLVFTSTYSQSLTVLMSAYTLYLNNITFPGGSLITLRSHTGVVFDATSQPIQNGAINLTNTVTLGGQPLLSYPSIYTHTSN